MFSNIGVVLSDRSVNIVILMNFVSIFGLGLVVPTLPLFAESFGVGYSGVGIFLSAYGLARLGTDLAAGAVVQRIGERRASAIALGLMAITAVATGAAPFYVFAVVMWSATGAGSALLFAAQFSYMLKVVPEERRGRVLSVFYGAFNVGFMAGSLIGGLLSDTFGLGTPLIAYGFVLLFLGLAYFRFVSDPPKAEAQPGAPEPTTGLRSLVRLPGFVTVMLTNLAYLWMVAAVFETLIPLFASDALGMSRSATGIVIGIALFTEFLVLYPAGNFSDKHGRRPVLLPSLLGLAVLSMLIGWSPNVLIFMILMGALGIASGYAGVPPAPMLADVVPQDRLSTSVGIFRFCGDLGFFFGPLVAGFGSEAFGFKGGFALVAIPSIVAFFFVLRTEETLKRPATLQPDASRVT
jgi:MFS family permease